LADWFERAVALHPHAPKEVSNWVMGEVLRVLNERQIEIDRLALEPEQLAELLALKESGEVSGRTAKSIFEKMLESGKGPRQILEEENLGQISDDTELRALAAAVLEERPTEVAGFLAGRKQLLSFFIGEVMKKTRGRANPQAAGELLRQLLEAHREPLEGAPVEGAPIDVASSPPAPAAAEDVGEPPPVPDAAGGVGEPPPAPDVVEDTGAATPEPAAAAPDAPAERPAVPDVKYLPRPKPPDEPDAEPPTDPGGEWRP
jgi:hypothetical protein